MERRFRSCSLLLLLTTLTAVPALAQKANAAAAKPVVARPVAVATPPQAQMEALARKLNLGVRRGDTPEPRPTTSGTVKRTPGFYQCFERGCVYASANGIHAASGAIFTRYVTEGAEHKTLGLPIGSESVCSAPRGFRYQDFEGGRIVWNNGTGATSIQRNPMPGDPANCEMMAVPPQPESATIAGTPAQAVPVGTQQSGYIPAPAGPSSGRFRVVLNGFFVSHETNDHAMEVDGKHDEVYIVADVAEFDATGGIADRRSRQSLVIGDIDGQETPTRIPGGRASAFGGLQTGDNYPTAADPWRRTLATSERKPPMLLWEGTLTRGSRAVVIVPTIWEWDGPRDVLINYQRSIVGSLARYVRSLNINETSSASLVTPMTGGPGAERLVGFEPTGNAADRPIGMSVTAGSFIAAADEHLGREWFTPKRLLLTYDMAQAVVTSTAGGFGPGVLPIVYQDHQDLAGNYVLFVQIEAVP